MLKLLSLYFSLILFMWPCFSTAKDNPKVDSLKQMLKKTPPEQQLELLLNIANEVQKTEPTAAETYYEQALNLLDLDKPSEEVFRFYTFRSRNHLYQHQYQHSLDLANKALEWKELAQPLYLKELFATIGTSNYYMSRFKEAIEAHLNSLRVCEEHGLAAETAGIMNNIGSVYIAMQNWKKTEEYLTSALKLAKKHQNKHEEGRAIGNMAILYVMQEEYDRAEEWFFKNLDFHLNNNDLHSACNIYNNIGVLYERTDKIPQALEYYQKALDLAVNLDDKASAALGYQNVAIAHSKLKQFDDAILNYKIGLEMTRKLGNRDKLRDGYLGISEMYEAMGDLKNALKYHKMYFLLNDSLVNEHHRMAVSELEIRYETEKKEKEILSLSEQKLINEASIIKKNASIRRLSITLVVALFIFGMTFVIMRQHSHNQKQKALINAITETQMAERKRIARDLHDSVGGSLALITNKLRNIIDTSGVKSEELLNSVETLTETSQQVRLISHNLMPGELVKFGLIPAIKTIIDQLNHVEINAQLYAHDMEKRLDPNQEIQLYRILQEIIQNVIKHAQAKNLNVYLNKYKKKLSMMVEDDGRGMNPGNDAIRGLGINNIKARVEYLRGSMNIDSTISKGTTINIQIPL
ncbi:MAG: tetratricopeptide repeat protein [Candidatus Cyclobacteriaceae bacterium M3_2C_046]